MLSGGGMRYDGYYRAIMRGWTNEQASEPFLDKAKLSRSLAVRGCVELRETRTEGPFSLRTTPPPVSLGMKARGQTWLGNVANPRYISLTLERANVLAVALAISIPRKG